MNRIDDDDNVNDELVAGEDIVDTNASLNSDLSLASNNDDTDNEPDSASDDDLSVTSAITQHQGATPPASHPI